MGVEDIISLKTPADALAHLRGWVRTEWQRLRWTQSELARRSGVPAATISRLELTVRGYNVDVGVVEVMRRDRNGKSVLHQYEIDFVVNAGFNKVYIQSAFALGTQDKVQQEKTSLVKSGDFFQKIIVENGYQVLRPDEDGIFRVGIIPFLLDDSILGNIIRAAKSSPRKMV